MFEQTFKNIDDILHKDAGCGSELDYVEQTSWVLFLKYLDDLEKDKATAAELTGKTYTNIIAPAFQWSVDTNIIFSTLLYSNSTIGDLLFKADNHFEFYSCSYMRYEIQNHWERLKRISKLLRKKSKWTLLL